MYLLVNGKFTCWCWVELQLVGSIGQWSLSHPILQILLNIFIDVSVVSSSSSKWSAPGWAEPSFYNIESIFSQNSLVIWLLAEPRIPLTKQIYGDVQFILESTEIHKEPQPDSLDKGRSPAKCSDSSTAMQQPCSILSAVVPLSCHHWNEAWGSHLSVVAGDAGACHK